MGWRTQCCWDVCLPQTELCIHHDPSWYHSRVVCCWFLFFLMEIDKLILHFVGNAKVLEQSKFIRKRRTRLENKHYPTSRLIQTMCVGIKIADRSKEQGRVQNWPVCTQTTDLLSKCKCSSVGKEHYLRIDGTHGYPYTIKLNFKSLHVKINSK